MTGNVWSLKICFHISIKVYFDILVFGVVLILGVWWVGGTILHGGPIELFLVPASAPQLV